MDWEQDFTRGYHVECLKYYYSHEHSLIGQGIMPDVRIDNIGNRGENLTFAVLSMNRSSLTIRLMESLAKWIPNFAGEFLIGDNGSVEDEKSKLRAVMELMPYRCRMVEFGRNYGVAGGRNRLFAEVKTDWILSADNDLYFVGNPLHKIQKDLAILGCHFMVMPLIDHDSGGTGIYGGHLYIENLKGVSAGGASALINPKLTINEEKPPFLCSFLAGGVSVLNKHSFFRYDGFDEAMFVGFEDTEFSIRLYQQGVKVGACGYACIVHDHPKPENSSDVDYEKQRFSVNHLKNSAEYFEKKHGFSVWNPMVENWVEGRLNELIGNKNTKDNPSTKDVRIALVIDNPDWALDHICNNIQKYLADEYSFRKIYLVDFDNLADILLLADDCQIIHFMWRPLASDYYSSYTQARIKSLGMTSKEFYKRYAAKKVISVGVYDHLMLDHSPDAHFTKKLFCDSETLVKSYTVSSEKLFNIYSQNKDIRIKPLAITQDGVDTQLFKPNNLQRFDNIRSRTIRIGWVGNSKWSAGDLKGINTIIRPACETLKEMGYDIELVASDRQEKMIPHNKMPDFYAGIDVYVCASTCEGTPNPVLESMACGVPVISTDVGIVPECFGTEQKKFILEERSVPCLVEKLKYLCLRPELFKILSQENLESIRAWDWSVRVNSFKEYFNSCLTKNQDGAL